MAGEPLPVLLGRWQVGRGVFVEVRAAEEPTPAQMARALRYMELTCGVDSLAQIKLAESAQHAAAAIDAGEPWEPHAEHMRHLLRELAQERAEAGDAAPAAPAGPPWQAEPTPAQVDSHGEDAGGYWLCKLEKSGSVFMRSRNAACATSQRCRACRSASFTGPVAHFATSSGSAASARQKFAR